MRCARSFPYGTNRQEYSIIHYSNARTPTFNEETDNKMRTENQNEEIVFFEVDSSRWGDMEKLFESRGSPKTCWCMVWRGTHKDRVNKDSRKTAMKKLVQSDVPVGLLGYFRDEPIAWCSIAPRTTYRNLGGLNDAPGETAENVWSVVCFFVTRKFRGRGIVSQLIRAAVEHARSRGATVVEAYPVDPDSPSYRFMGFPTYFEDFGFVTAGNAGTRRYVMRLNL